jgi:hypothetical protein
MTLSYYLCSFPGTLEGLPSSLKSKWSFIKFVHFPRTDGGLSREGRLRSNHVAYDFRVIVICSIPSPAAVSLSFRSLSSFGHVRVLIPRQQTARMSTTHWAKYECQRRYHFQ